MTPSIDILPIEDADLTCVDGRCEAPAIAPTLADYFFATPPWLVHAAAAASSVLPAWRVPSTQVA